MIAGQYAYQSLILIVSSLVQSEEIHCKSAICGQFFKLPLKAIISSSSSPYWGDCITTILLIIIVIIILIIFIFIMGIIIVITIVTIIIINIIKSITQFVFYSCGGPLGNLDWAISTNGPQPFTLTYECYVIIIIVIIVFMIIITTIIIIIFSANSTFITLHLHRWPDGGAFYKYKMYMIKYKV